MSTDDNFKLQQGPICHATVDRILRQQHAQQQASEAAKKSEQQALSSSPSPSLSPNPVDSQNVPPSQTTKPARPVPPNPTRNPLMRLIGKPDSSSPPEPSIPVPRVPLKQASESRSNTGSGVTPVTDISEKTIGIVVDLSPYLGRIKYRDSHQSLSSRVGKFVAE